VTFSWDSLGFKIKLILSTFKLSDFWGSLQKDEVLLNLAWGSFVERNYQPLFSLNHYAIYGTRFIKGVNEEREFVIEELTWSTLFRVKEIARKFDASKCKRGVLPWLCQISKNEFRNRIKKQIGINDEPIEEYIARTRKEIYDGTEETSVSVSTFSRNVTIVHNYLRSNYTDIEIEVILSYFKFYDREKKSQHISKELKFYFQNNGISDDRRTQLISRFKSGISKALKSVIKFKRE
jgi:hypothetical protein